MPRIKWLEVSGFRAYGQNVQRLEFAAPVAAIWGANSQGKTSLAEALEFLLTGAIVRRELLASAQDEFADSLRNAHLPATGTVLVGAEIEISEANTHTIKRTLTADYGRRSDCASVLEIDGAKATELDLAKLGIKLSQPPLSAPILMQHTLGYLFSARPQDRAGYFKALLEVTDLEDMRTAISDSAVSVDAAIDPLLAKLQTAAEQSDLAPALGPLLTQVPSAAKIGQGLSAACAAVLSKAGESAPPALADRVARLGQALNERRAKTFPTSGFDRRPLPPLPPIPDEMWVPVENFLEQVKQVTEEGKRLLGLIAAPRITVSRTKTSTALFMRLRTARFGAFANTSIC